MSTDRRKGNWWFKLRTVADKIDLNVRTVTEKMKAGEFGRDAVNLGTAAAPDYRISETSFNAYLRARCIFADGQTETAPSPDPEIDAKEPIFARNIGELRRKVRQLETQAE
jgi:hypothetical protein